MKLWESEVFVKRLDHCFYREVVELISNAGNFIYRRSTRVSVRLGNAIILHRSTVARVARVRVSEWQIAPFMAVGPLGQLGQRVLRPAVSQWKPAGGPVRIQHLHSADAFASGMITMTSCALICRPALPPLKPPRRLRMVSGRSGGLGTRVRGHATAVSISIYFYSHGTVIPDTKTKDFKNLKNTFNKDSRF